MKFYIEFKSGGHLDGTICDPNFDLNKIKSGEFIVCNNSKNGSQMLVNMSEVAYMIVVKEAENGQH